MKAQACRRVTEVLEIGDHRQGCRRVARIVRRGLVEGGLDAVEARHAIEAGAAIARQSRVVAPQIINSLTSERMLVMERRFAMKRRWKFRRWRMLSCFY